MEQYEPSSPVYSRSKAPKEGSIKPPASRKRRRDIHRDLLQNMASSSGPRLEELQVDETQAGEVLESQPRLLEATPQDDEDGRKIELDSAPDATLLLQAEDSFEEGSLRSPGAQPDANARTADPMNEVESGAANGGHTSARPTNSEMGGTTAEEGVCSHDASARAADPMDETEGNAANNVQSSLAPLRIGGTDGSAKEGGGSSGGSAHMEGRVPAVESGAADAAQSSAGPVGIGVAGGSAKEGGGSPGANACMDEVDKGAASDAESSADNSCDSGPVPVGVAAERLGGQNKNGQGQEGRRGEAIADSESGVKESSEQTFPFAEPDLEDPELRSEVVRELEKLLSTWGDNTSIFCAAKPSSTGPGVIYEFRNVSGGRVTCPYFPASCARVHDSTNFGLLRRGSEVTYICHGESCKATPRSGNFRLGVIPLPIAAAFGDSQPLNSERDHLYSDRQLLPLPFLRENLNVKKGDVGGAIILERLYVRTGLKFAFTSSGSFYWSGRCWAKDESGGRILRVLREELSKIEAAYMQEAE